MTLAIFLLRRSIDRNMQFPLYSILLAASAIILSRSRTERKPRGSTLDRAVCLVVRRMKIVSRGNATWFIGRRVAHVIARRTRRSSDTYTLYYFFFLSPRFFLVSARRNNTSTIENPLPKTLRYTEAVARTRARPLVARRSPFVSTQF